MPCLITDQDLNVFLKYLREAMEGVAFELHGFVLMPNHVHLLATAYERGAVAKVMHSVCLRYAAYFNRKYDRTGPLFEGRYWSSIIETGDHFYLVLRYIELNPVRARMVDSPEQFPWSSYRHNTGSGHRAEITPHELYLALGKTAADRARAWAGMVAQGMTQDELDRMRKRFRGNRPLGSVEFENRMGTVPRDGSRDTSPGHVPRTRPQDTSPIT